MIDVYDMMYSSIAYRKRLACGSPCSMMYSSSDDDITVDTIRDSRDRASEPSQHIWHQVVVGSI
jgi:hypothetical protein